MFVVSRVIILTNPEKTQSYRHFIRICKKKVFCLFSWKPLLFFKHFFSEPVVREDDREGYRSQVFSYSFGHVFIKIAA